jgi:hypothetical protein
MVNSRPDRVTAILLTLILSLYSAGHGWMRCNHYLVHDATFYTDNGTRVRTDWIRLGKWRTGPLWTSIESLYLPARLIESFYRRYMSKP